MEWGGGLGAARGGAWKICFFGFVGRKEFSFGVFIISFDVFFFFLCGLICLVVLYIWGNMFV